MDDYFNGDIIMIPRIFLGSTFYDFKYLREELGNFIKEYGFEPVRFENGDVGYTHGENLDISCYEEMKKSEMAVVIIGGRYGTPASDNLKTDELKNFTSVTMREFKEALNNNIPIYVFVESNVLSENNMYQINSALLEDENSVFKFAHVDNINVHRFLNEIRSIPKLPIIEFKNVSDIKAILKKQWASMFYKYLSDLKSNPTKELKPSIEDIYLAIQKMNISIEKVEEKIIGDNHDLLDTISFQKEVEDISNAIATSFEFVTKDQSKEFVKKYLSFFIDHFIEAYEKGYLEYPFSENQDDIKIFENMFSYDGVIIVQVKEHIGKIDLSIENSTRFKESVVERLMKHDYLRKMKFIE